MPTYDKLIEQIAEYVIAEHKFSTEALTTARWCLLDSMGCAMAALKYPACTQLLGGWGESGEVVVPGTNAKLPPMTAARDIGVMVRYLDFNDTWLAAEWGHPSDNLGAILSLAQVVGIKTVEQLLPFMIKAYEIQGVLALNHSLNKLGFDHVFYVKLASAAVSAAMLGYNLEQTKVVISHVFADGGPLRTYRHGKNTGPRKSWAAGDASARGLYLAWFTKEQPGMCTVLSDNNWGYEARLANGKKLELAQPLADYVMTNVLFKVQYPAEFHAQTAVEAAIELSKQVSVDEIQSISLRTQEPAVRIIAKDGPLNNYADRDHCLQYMVAVALANGNLTADDYLDEFVQPVYDELRNKMTVIEAEDMTADYYDANKRYIPNEIVIKTVSNAIAKRIDAPLGHKKRRVESRPHLEQKFARNTGFNIDFDDASVNQRSLADFIQLFSECALRAPLAS